MIMFSLDNFTIFTIMVYLLATAAGITGMLRRRTAWKQAACVLALGAFFCQTFALIMGMHKASGLTYGAYLQMLAWFFLLCGIIVWWRLRHEAIILFAAPFGLILFLVSAPSLHMGVNLPPSLSTPFYALHIGALFLGLGLLCVASIAGILFLFLQKRLKMKKTPRGIWQDMPSLAVLDKINAGCVLAAFPLYTTGILAGLFWAKPVFGSTFNNDPKEIISIFIWILLAILFHNRLAKGWHGRKPAILVLVIFILSLFSILVVNMFLPTHHAFGI